MYIFRCCLRVFLCKLLVKLKHELKYRPLRLRRANALIYCPAKRFTKQKIDRKI